MQHAIINAMKYMRAIKDRIARPVYQLAIISVSLYTARCINRGNHRSVIFRALPSQLDGRHSNPVVTTPMIALDFSGTTHQSASRNVAFNHVINQSVNQAQDVLTTRTELNSTIDTYPEAETSGKTIKFHCTKKPETLRSSPKPFYSLKWVTIDRAIRRESSATKIAQNNEGERRQSTEENHAVVLNYPDIATVGSLRLVFTSSTTKPAATTSRNIVPKQYQNDIVATNQNDVTALHQLIPNPMRNNHQLVTLDNSKRRRNKNDVASSSATGSSTQQLVIQLAQFLTTQQLIALQLHSETTTHHSIATVPLTRVDV
ncbi:hypothetical protein F511_37531 [Dorcoceras hygrometricum]|uniref:Uncharacterized protein n=1 Tax=Dorcoceras hygrometricum TaxID=472368 RepID=A0A2Z7D9E4_9LAMI|nr:hypothetical protein F511_37531 [Dorcoceras hygrometricum]